MFDDVRILWYLLLEAHLKSQLQIIDVLKSQFNSNEYLLIEYTITSQRINQVSNEKEIKRE